MQQERDNRRIPKAQSRSQTGAPSSLRSRPQRSTPPYNPGLQKLVEGKQAWDVPLDEDAKAKGFLGWHQRGYLPHYDAPWVTQIITLRLVDSLPASRRSEWEQLLRIENSREALPAGAPTSRRLGVNKVQPTSNAQGVAGHASLIEAQSRSQTGAPLATTGGSEAGRERRKRLESYLDRGLGECWLRQPAIAELTEGALRFFDGERYRPGCVGGDAEPCAFAGGSLGCADVGTGEKLEGFCGEESEQVVEEAWRVLGAGIPGYAD